MKLNLGPEFLKYLAAHASASGKHPPTLEKLAEGTDREARLPREQLETAYAAGFVEARRGQHIRMFWYCVDEGWITLTERLNRSWGTFSSVTEN